MLGEKSDADGGAVTFTRPELNVFFMIRSALCRLACHAGNGKGALFTQNLQFTDLPL